MSPFWSFVRRLSKNAKPRDGRTVANAIPSRGPVRQMSDELLQVAHNFIPAWNTTVGCPKSLKLTSRICGAWIEKVPELKTAGYHGKALQVSVKAFAMAIASQRAPNITSTSDALDAHGAALGSIHCAIRRGRMTEPEELSAAIMFLFLSEVLLPAASSSQFHAAGLTKLMHAKGPGYYTRGMPHALFIGFRPAIIVWSISNRKKVFLGSPEWSTIPFLETPSDPLQSLMTIGASIATVLDSIDRLDTSFEPSIAFACLDSLNEIMVSLDDWKASRFTSMDPQHISTVDEENISTEIIVYHDITEANIFTHFWAFRIICAVQAQSLFHQKLQGVRPLPPALLIAESTLNSHATSIMKSVTYLTREDMKLYGAVSLMLPLRVSYEYLERRGDLLPLWKQAARNINLAGHDFLYNFVLSESRFLWPQLSVTRSTWLLDTT